MLPDERGCRSVNASVLALSVFCAFRARFALVSTLSVASAMKAQRKQQR